MKTLPLFFCLTFLFSCSNENRIIPQQKKSEATELDTALKSITKPISDTTIAAKTPISTTSLPKKQKIKPRLSYGRESDGCSNDNLNGKAILVQLDLNSSVLLSYPDTIIQYLKSYYNNLEHFFPRSIADDFEHGISTERISYPKLNFIVELYENEYAAKPYKTVQQSISKE